MSSWTTSGTVSVTNNSKKVYGAGTPWVSNGKTRAGDEFIAPNGARHEVESVQSNTELTLVAPYMGATASGQSYALIHTGLLPAELAVKISDLQSKYLMTIAQLYEWETSEAATVPITNPATGVTMQVKPLERFLASLGDGSIAGSFATLSVVSTLSDSIRDTLRLNNTNDPRSANLQLDSLGNLAIWTYEWGGRGWVKPVTVSPDRLAVTGALTTNSIKEDVVGNVGIGVTPSVHSGGRSLNIGNTGAGSFAAVSLGGSGSDYGGVGYNIGWQAANEQYKYLGADVSSWIQFANGGFKFLTAPAGIAGQTIDFTQDMTLVNGALLLGETISYDRKLYVKGASPSTYLATLTNTSPTAPYGLQIILAGVTGGTGAGLITAADGDGDRFKVLGNGNVQNQNNSYGAISDLKLKGNIVDCTPKLDKLLQVRIVNYNLKTDPEHRQLGVIAQELELISPGLIEETPDYEDVEVTPAHTEQKITQRQKVEYRDDVRYEILEVDGKWKRLPIRTSVEIPLFEEFPLFEQDGTAVMECVEAAQSEVVGEDGEIISPAKDAVWRQATHRVPVMEDVTEPIDVPAMIERRATGEVTKSVKYSVFVPMLIKAMQEQQVIIDRLESRLTALEAA